MAGLAGADSPLNEASDPGSALPGEIAPEEAGMGTAAVAADVFDLREPGQPARLVR